MKRVGLTETLNLYLSKVTKEFTSTPLHPVKDIAELTHGTEHRGRPPLEGSDN